MVVRPIDKKQKIPYPKSVFFIVSNEFCERFSYYGMRTILSLYLIDILLYSETDAKIIYHAFTMLVYFFPVLGAMLADSWLGKFKTIFYVSIIYAIGNIVLAFSAIQEWALPHVTFSMIGLLLIAVGSGGIKPCVSAFGGDQFVLPQQELQLAAFFSMFYFAINSGSLISTTITPILRENVHCFDTESCFPLAFGVPGILMAVSIVIFVAGKPLYKIKPPEGNMVLRVSKAIGNAIKTKSKNKNGEKKTHWLDWAKERYGEKLVEDIKSTLKVLTLYIPLPVFWALFDQQGTSWTFLARRMDGYIGFYTILPDQFQVVNPLLILAFIPLFQGVVYPLFYKCRILRTPLQKMVCGGTLAAISFVIAGVIALVLEAGQPSEPSSGNGHLRIYNTYPCDVQISASSLNLTSYTIAQGDYYTDEDVEVRGNITTPYSLTGSCITGVQSGQFHLYEEMSIGYYFDNTGGHDFYDSAVRAESGNPSVRNLINTNGYNGGFVNISYLNSEGNEVLTSNSSDLGQHAIDHGSVTIRIGHSEYSTDFHLGGVYSILATANGDNDYKISLLTITEPNAVHMLWLLPPYVIITAGEIMFSITGLEFSYSQAPSSMKSVLQAGWLLTTAFGNLLVIIIEAISQSEVQSTNAFVYASIMLLDMFIFAIMAMRYKYVENNTTDVDLGEDNPTFKSNGNANHPDN